MAKPRNDFVSGDSGDHYRVRMGRHVASSLSGFIAGVITASIIWLAVAYVVNLSR